MQCRPDLYEWGSSHHIIGATITISYNGKPKVELFFLWQDGTSSTSRRDGVLNIGAHFKATLFAYDEVRKVFEHSVSLHA